ncbi:MAG: hypothetical protein MSA89_01960 [Clostridium sp.]|nr:hypothetical protein [Clostridium sp.]
MENSIRDSLNEFIEYIKNLDINLAQTEQLGIIFIIFGYLEFFTGADIDILESLEINYTGKSPDEVTLLGQEIILIGYVLLWIVSIERVNEKSLRNSKNDNFYISAYIQVADSYLLSVIAHSIRLQAFYKIVKTNSNGEFIE